MNNKVKSPQKRSTTLYEAIYGDVWSNKVWPVFFKANYVSKMV
jgi:hypothetical protein